MDVTITGCKIHGGSQRQDFAWLEIYRNPRPLHHAIERSEYSGEPQSWEHFASASITAHGTDSRVSDFKLTASVKQARGESGSGNPSAVYTGVLINSAGEPVSLLFENYVVPESLGEYVTLYDLARANSLPHLRAHRPPAEVRDDKEKNAT